VSERFSPSEVARILERAADLEDQGGASGPHDPGDSTSFSREDLERIAAESGISLDNLRTALANREVGSPSFGERLLGGPLKATHAIALARTLDEAGLERAVALLRTEVGTTGRMERLGSTLSWMGMLGGSTPIEALIETQSSGTTIRLSARFDGLIGGLYGGIGGGMGGGLSYFWVSGAMALFGQGPEAVVIGLGFSMGSALLLARALYGGFVSKKVATLRRLEGRLRSELGSSEAR
jgi:hypothetical protein